MVTTPEEIRSDKASGAGGPRAASVSGYTISDIEVNKRIQSKFCKVVSDYGEGAGYIMDDQNGVVLSSFHLVSAIKPLRIPEDSFSREVINVLYSADYIDDELRLTKKALETNSTQEITKAADSIKQLQHIIRTVEINPSEIRDLLANVEHKEWTLTSFKNAKEVPTRKFEFSSDSDGQTKIAIALECAGYLNSEFILTGKAIQADGLEDVNVIPVTQHYRIITMINSNPKEMDRIKKTSIENFNKDVAKVLAFFKRGSIEKEVVLLSETIEIECDDEILIGKIDIPEGLAEDARQKVLKNFAYFDVVPIKITKFKDAPLFLNSGKVILTGRTIDLLPEDGDVEEPMVGEKVYFGGYPLTQHIYTFSTGMISSVTSFGERTCFVIEAPIAPGNSGSPVFIQRNGQVYWIGVINSEVAHVSEEILGLQERLKMQPEVMQIGGVSLVRSLRELTTTLLVNLSTGKGKAFKIPSIRELCDPGFINHDDLKIDQFLDFLVPKKGKNNAVELAKKEVDKIKQSRVHEEYKINGNTYYIGCDNHGNKHTKLSKKIDAKTLRCWGKNPATFNLKFAHNYNEVLKKVIISVANSKNPDKTKFVRFPVAVGWDGDGIDNVGHETSVIQLYYNPTGSHMRPKCVKSMNKEETASIIDVDYGAQQAGTSDAAAGKWSYCSYNSETLPAFTGDFFDALIDEAQQAAAPAGGNTITQTDAPEQGTDARP